MKGRSGELPLLVKILVLVLLGAVLTGFDAHVAKAAVRKVPCRSATTVPGKIRCMALRYETPGGPAKALAVARCESGFYPRAFNGSHAGIYQHSLRYWPARWFKYARPFGLPNDPFNATANILVTMRMVTDQSIGWGPWSCA